MEINEQTLQDRATARAISGADFIGLKGEIRKAYLAGADYGSGVVLALLRDAKRPVVGADNKTRRTITLQS